MNKADYLITLKNALGGLAPEVITDILNGYEMRFIEGASLGRSEEEIVQGLDLPQVVAARFLDHSHYAPPVKNAHNAHNATVSKTATGTRFFSFVGLSFFNLFLIIPTIVFCSLLFASYVGSLGMMVGGSAFTAASLADVNEVTLNHPKDGKNKGTISLASNAGDEQAVLNLTKDGIRVNEDAVDSNRTSGIHFGKRNDPLQPSAWKGIGITLGGILLLLINLIVTKYSFIGVKRYIMLNYSILKGA